MSGFKRISMTPPAALRKEPVVMEASTLGLAPGVWPTAVDYEGHVWLLFERGPSAWEQELVHVEYRTIARDGSGTRSLIVLND